LDPDKKEKVMPTYQYQCEACHHTFEVFQSFMDKKLRKCPQCGKFKLHRLIGTGGGIIFKGSGFYETDYKRKSPSTKECSAKDGQGNCACQAAKQSS